MRYATVIALLLAINAGVLTGVFLWSDVFGAEPAPTGFEDAAGPAQTPSVFLVHEIGTAKVNGTVEVTSLPHGRLVPVAGEMVLAIGQTHRTPFFDVGDCKNLSVYTQHTGGDTSNRLATRLVLSADGATPHGVLPGTAFSGEGLNKNSVVYFQAGGHAVTAPTASVELNNNSPSSAVSVTAAWLYCAR